MIDILMATYNGEKYIREQLDSLINQTYQDFRILIRDDGSSDNTLMIVGDYVVKYPEKVKLISDDLKCGSSASNFMQLLNYAESEYVMFCDQDDFWYPNKVEKMLDYIKKYEVEYSSGILVFSSYYSGDENLQNLQNSRIKIDKHSFDASRMLVENCINGCCMIVNKELYKNIQHTFSKEILMHDWWLAIYASFFGKIYYVKDSLMIYRQHNSQSVGENKAGFITYVKSRRSKKYSDIMKKYLNQAKYFYDLFGEKIDDKKLSTIIAFINIYDYGKIKRILVLRKYKLLKSKLIARLGQYYYL